MTLPRDLLPLPPGLVAVTGDEGSGKTRLLRELGTDLLAPADSPAPPMGAWLDLALPAQDGRTPRELWRVMQARCPDWNAPLHGELVQALDLDSHQDKTLSMLSTGSRRKVGLAGLLAAGCTVTCLDQPYAALDAASMRVLRAFLVDVAGHGSRTWVMADYEADPLLPWQRIVNLD